MLKKSSLFISIVLILALSFSFTVSADYATVDISKVTATGEGEPANGFTPDVLFDGDEFTRWGSMQAGESVTAVFDKEYVIEAVEIRFFRAAVREHLFTFEYSSDGNNWTEIKSTKEHSTADESKDTGDDLEQQEGYFETFPLVNPVTAQHFRYTYEGRIDGATIGSVWDMKFVIGAAAPAAPEPEPEAAVPAAVEAPASEAPVPAPAQTAPAPAPRTADPIVLLAIGSIISAAGAVIVKKRK